jgi:hypothetical protein
MSFVDVMTICGICGMFFTLTYEKRLTGAVKCGAFESIVVRLRQHPGLPATRGLLAARSARSDKLVKQLDQLVERFSIAPRVVVNAEDVFDQAVRRLGRNLKVDLIFAALVNQHIAVVIVYPSRVSVHTLTVYSKGRAVGSTQADHAPEGGAAALNSKTKDRKGNV